MKQSFLLLAFLNLFQCIGDAVINTDLYVVLSSDSMEDVFSCDSVNPYLLNLSNNKEKLSLSELTSEPNYNDSTCLRRWKLNGVEDYLQNKIMICLDILDSTLVLDTVQIIANKEPTLMLHIGKNASFLGNDLMNFVPLDWSNEHYQDTLFVEITNYR